MIPSRRAVLRRSGALAVALALSGCGAMQRIDVSRFEEPVLAPSTAQEALNAAATSRACFTTDSTPAVVETRTEQVQERPARHDAEGRLVSAARYRTVTETRIVADRQDVIVQTVCPEDMTPQFVAALQRALHARGHYAGPITGDVTPETRAAIRRFQSAEGLPTSALSLAAAKRLGLAVYSDADTAAG
jgi:hypothetical protein